jgi:hypothetical protein
MTARFGVTFHNPTRFTTLQLFNFIQFRKMRRSQANGSNKIANRGRKPSLPRLRLPGNKPACPPDSVFLISPSPVTRPLAAVNVLDRSSNGAKIKRETTRPDINETVRRTAARCRDQGSRTTRLSVSVPLELDEVVLVQRLSRLPADLKISPAPMIDPDSATIKTPTAALPA